MEDLRYYLAVFKRRLPYFLIVSTLVSAISVVVAYTLPPVYESRMVLLVEAPKIPRTWQARPSRHPRLSSCSSCNSACSHETTY